LLLHLFFICVSIYTLYNCNHRAENEDTQEE